MREKVFFSRSRAEKYAGFLLEQGFEVEVWSGRDAFGQRQFFVKWVVFANGNVVVNG